MTYINFREIELYLRELGKGQAGRQTERWTDTQTHRGTQIQTFKTILERVKKHCN